MISSDPYITNTDIRWGLESASVRLHTLSERSRANRLFRVTRAIGDASDKIYPQSIAVTPHAIVHVVEVNCDKRRLQGRQSWKPLSVLCRPFGPTILHATSIMPEKREVLDSNPSLHADSDRGTLLYLR